MTANEQDGGSISRSSTSDTDVHGKAAILLVESLIHSLIDRSVIGIDDAIDLVTVAMDSRTEIAADAGDSDHALDRSLSLLASIRSSLSIDRMK